MDRRVRVAELVLKFLICGLGLAAALLVATDTQAKEIFMIKKKAKFTDMKAFMFLVIANGIALTTQFNLLSLQRFFLSV